MATRSKRLGVMTLGWTRAVGIAATWRHSREMTTRVEHADMMEAIPRLIAEGIVCDAVVTDPPYHLTNRAHRKSGFMGQQWDGGDIAFRPETWAAVATIMRPGAFLVALKLFSPKYLMKSSIRSRSSMHLLIHKTFMLE